MNQNKNEKKGNQILGMNNRTKLQQNQNRANQPTQN